MTPSTFKALFPEFASDSDTTVKTFIDLADPYFNATRWGDFLTEGMACFVAHRMAIAAQSASDTAHTGATSLPMVRRKVGDVEAQTSEAILVKSIDNPYLSTSYGRRYWELVQMIGTGMVVV